MSKGIRSVATCHVWVRRFGSAGGAVPDCMGVAWWEWRGKTIGRMRRWHLSPEIARTLVAVRRTAPQCFTHHPVGTYCHCGSTVGMPLAVRRTTVHQMQHGCSERCQARCMPPAVPWEYYGDHEVLFGTAMPCSSCCSQVRQPSAKRRDTWLLADPAHDVFQVAPSPLASGNCHICAGLGSPLPHLRRTGPTSATSGAGTGLTGATSALGLGSLLPHLHRGRLLLRYLAPKLGSPLDWTDAFHICTGTGSASAP